MSIFYAIIVPLVIQPAFSFISEKLTDIYYPKKVIIQDVIRDMFSDFYKLLQKTTTYRKIIALIPLLYTMFLTITLNNDLFFEFVRYINGIILIKCLFSITTIVPNVAFMNPTLVHYYAPLLFLQHYNLIWATTYTNSFILYSSIFLGFLSVISRKNYTISLFTSFPVIYTWKQYILK